MVDSFEIQTETQVRAIESKRMMQESLSNITDNGKIIDSSEIADKVVNQLSNMAIETDTNIDLSNIEDKIDTINTGVIEAQTQDILIQFNRQQEQINSIEEKINVILEKLEE